MGGILLILFFIIGFIVYIWLIRLPIKWAKKRGIEGRKRLYIGIASFLVVSAVFFGKNLISYTAFRYYCKNEAGMTVYKTLAEWKKENPGVWEKLRKVKDFRDYEDRDKYPNVELKRHFDGKEYSVNSDGNQRIILYDRTDYIFWAAIDKNVYLLVDNKTQEILAEYKYFQWVTTWDTSIQKNGRRTRSILGNETCAPDRWSFRDYRESFSNLSLTEEEK